MNDSRTVRLVIFCLFSLAFTALALVGLLAWHRAIEVAVLVALVGTASSGMGALGAMLAQTNSKPKSGETDIQATIAAPADKPAQETK